MSLTAAVTQLQSLTSGLTGMRLAPNYPPEQANAYPFAISWIDTGTFDSARTGNVLTDGRHTLGTEIHVARRDLPTAVEAAAPFIELLVTALQSDPTLNDEVLHITSLTYDFGPLQYGGVDTIGYRVSIDVATDNC